jgi:hypothetical protein
MADELRAAIDEQQVISTISSKEQEIRNAAEARGYYEPLG